MFYCQSQGVNMCAKMQLRTSVNEVRKELGLVSSLEMRRRRKFFLGSRLGRGQGWEEGHVMVG
jgi:hypothetical protein